MRRLLVVFVLLSMAMPVLAQQPAVDGVMAANEYSRSETKSGITVAARLSLDGTTLYLAVQARTAGWVALGAGAQVMDKAYMVLAYVTGSTQTISEETGRGKSHVVNAERILIAASVAEADGFTTLEIALPAAGFVKDKTVELIAAFGTQDNRTGLHRARASFKLAL
jgi:hypothetical protein